MSQKSAFSASTYEMRISKVRVSMQEAGIDALVVSPSSDLVYLCGYDAPVLERPTLLIVDEDSEPLLLVPRLEAARVLEPTTEVVKVLPWSETDDPYEKAASALRGARRIGVGDQMWSAHLIELLRKLPDAEYRKASDAISPVRCRKEPEELELLERAARAADAVASGLSDIVSLGMTEREAAQAISSALLESGCDDVEFVIVASGPNSASPHHEPSDRRISRGDVVVCDFGGPVSGYHSDITRTMVFGNPPEGFDRVYAVVLEAQRSGVEAASSGTAAATVDRAARAVIEKAGYGDRFIHRTGHGIGLDIHEAPYIAENAVDVLEEGMCFSIEPGIYLEGVWGIRIEDIVVAGKNEGIRLNRSSRDVIYA